MASFFEGYYRPTRLADSPAKTVRTYRATVRIWTLLAGDPPLKDITVEMLVRFRDCLAKMRGLKPVDRMHSESIRKHLRVVQMILDKAGPPGFRQRDNAGLISGPVPWLRPPHSTEKIPRFVPADLLDFAYAATVAMERPRIEGIKPPAWWKALLAVAYNTQLRKRTLFEMKMSEVDWGHRCLNLPAQRLKSGKPKIVHLNDTALEHLKTIRTDRDLVFPFDASESTYYRCFHALLTAAAILRKEHFGLHDLRRTASTMLFQDSPQAAQYALGHSSLTTTMKYYVSGASIVQIALDKLPQPPAFAGGVS